MADTDGVGAEKVAQAYNQAVSSGFAAVDAGIAQGAVAVKLFTETMQVERDEYGKVWGQAMGHARSRSANLAAVVQGMAVAPSFGSEATEPVNKLIEGDLAFCQAWTQTCAAYLAGAETRRSAAAQGLLESGARMIEPGQEAMISAVKYGEALLEWSLATAQGSRG